jgi:protein-S-isoprenylcysteine O-methyltransferase Ste14
MRATTVPETRNRALFLKRLDRRAREEERMNEKTSRPDSHSKAGYRLIVAVQVVSICGVLFGGAYPWNRLIGWIALLPGGAIFLWALVTMGRQLRMSPEVKPEARLLSHGPYRYVRHPMYTGGLLVTLAFLLLGFNGVRLVAWGVLAVDLWIKMGIEERLLKERFPDYEAYSRRTRRVVPFFL